MVAQYKVSGYLFLWYGTGRTSHKYVESSLVLAFIIKVFIHLCGRLNHDIISYYSGGLMYCEYFALKLCIPHLVVMTSPKLRHYEIKYLWIHQVDSSKNFIYTFFIVQALQWPALKVYSNKGIGI